MTTITPIPVAQTQAPAFRGGASTKVQQKVIDTTNKAFREIQLKEMVKTDSERARIMMMNDFSVASVMKTAKKSIQSMQRTRIGFSKITSKDVALLNFSKKELQQKIKLFKAGKIWGGELQVVYHFFLLMHLHLEKLVAC